MVDATTQAAGTTPRFLPFNAAPGIAGYGYSVPLPYQALPYQGLPYQTQLQPQLQLVPVLTPQGWVGYLIVTLGQAANLGLGAGFGAGVGAPPLGIPFGNAPGAVGQYSAFGAVPSVPAGYGYAPQQLQPQNFPVPFAWQQPQMPWQQQPGFNPFIGQPFPGGAAH